MDGNLAIFIPIVAIGATAWVIGQVLDFIRHRRDSERGESGENARLAEENELLRATVARLEQRMAVLERIATDPATRTAHEIEQLR
jgi:cell division protein FtsB